MMAMLEEVRREGRQGGREGGKGQSFFSRHILTHNLTNLSLNRRTATQRPRTRTTTMTRTWRARRTRTSLRRSRMWTSSWGTWTIGRMMR